MRTRRDSRTDIVSPDDRRGRGSATNASGRFEPHQIETVDDGWGQDPRKPAQTRIAIDKSRTIIARNSSPDLSFDRSINPYRGCEHGCTYCFARPTHAYLGLSPGLDFETRLTAKPDAPRILDKELRRKGYAVDPIAIGTNTDAYQPIERQYRIMRGVLKVLEAFHHPVTIVTKGGLITRDADILGTMGRSELARVSISMTTLDSRLSRKMEPRAASPKRRLQMIETLADAGCPVGVMVAPIVPGLTDPELEQILTSARDAGAKIAGYVMLRMPLEIKDIFRDWLIEAYPNRAAKVLRGVRELHDGKDYDPDWHTRMTGTGPMAAVTTQRFATAIRRLGLTTTPPPLRTDLFAPPLATNRQPALPGFD